MKKQLICIDEALHLAYCYKTETFHLSHNYQVKRFTYQTSQKTPNNFQLFFTILYLSFSFRQPNFFQQITKHKIYKYDIFYIFSNSNEALHLYNLCQNILYTEKNCFYSFLLYKMPILNFFIKKNCLLKKIQV